MGLPGSGKTTLSTALAPLLNAVHFNGDEVRANVNRDLGFSEADRIEQARRMGWLCDQVIKAGGYAIADFICPTAEARAAFQQGSAALIVWINRIESGRFEDTNRLFTPPERFAVEVKPEGSPEYWAEQVLQHVRPVFDAQQPTALFVGRYQPFHDGHRALIAEGIRRVGQACIAVRSMQPDEKNPYSFEYVRSRIESRLREFAGRFVVVEVPNITHVFYGRDVGYAVERIDLDAATQAISATDVRSRLRLTA